MTEYSPAAKATGIIFALGISYLVLTAFSGGITNRTQKNADGCICHGATPTGSVSVSFLGPDTLGVGETGIYTLAVERRAAECGRYQHRRLDRHAQRHRRAGASAVGGRTDPSKPESPGSGDCLISIFVYRASSPWHRHTVCQWKQRQSLWRSLGRPMEFRRQEAGCHRPRHIGSGRGAPTCDRSQAELSQPLQSIYNHRIHSPRGG